MKMRSMAGAVAGLFLVAGLARAQTPTIQIDRNNRTIAVTTSDSASADADAAIVHIGFKDYASDASAAYAAGSKTSNAVASALKALGVEKQNIESESQSVAEVQLFELQNLSPAERLIRKYSVQQSWSVKVKAQDAAKTLDAAIKAGANNSGQIDWTVNDDDSLQAQAAARALQRARAIAGQMAKGLGAQLGSLMYASNEAPQRPVFALKGRAAMTMEAGSASGQQKVEPLSLSPRRVERSATVYAVFAIE